MSMTTGEGGEQFWGVSVWGIDPWTTLHTALTSELTLNLSRNISKTSYHPHQQCISVGLKHT